MVKEDEVIPDITASDLKLIAVKLDKRQVETLDTLVYKEHYSCRSEIIRVALRDLIREIEGRY